MHIWTKTPLGVVAHLDLGAIPIYRLELTGIPNKGLGVLFRYVVSGTTSYQTIVVLEVEGLQPGTKVCDEIALKALRSQNPDKVLRSDENKKSLREAIKTLNNVFDKNAELKRVPEYEAASAGLVDTYEKVLACLQTGSEAKGEYQGYNWVITKEPFGWSWADPGENLEK